MIPTTTPVQFEPDALVSSIRRMQALRPRTMYLTHFGRVGDVDRLADTLVALVGAMVEVAHRCAAI